MSAVTYTVIPVLRIFAWPSTGSRAGDPAWPAWGKTEQRRNRRAEEPKTEFCLWIGPAQVIPQLSALDASLFGFFRRRGDDENLDAIGYGTRLVKKELLP